jgi:hypothetical protein
VSKLASANHADSWFDRLSAVAITLIVQWVRICYGFSAPGGKTQEPNDTSCELLLGAVPTPPLSNDTYPPFEIENVDLGELLEYASEGGQLNPVTATDAVGERFTRAAEEVADIPNPLSSGSLRDALAEADKKNSATLASYEEALDTMPSVPFSHEPPVTLRGDPSQVTPAKMYAMNLTPTDIALFTGNTETKVQVVKALAEQELEGWRMFRVMADAQFSHWENQIQQLEAFRDMLRGKKQEGEGIVERARDVHQHVSKLEEATEGVRHFRFANETYGQLQRTPLPAPYLPTRPMQYGQSPGQGQYPPPPMYYQMGMPGNSYILVPSHADF